MENEKIQSSPFKVQEIDELYNNVKRFRSTAFSRDLLNFIAKFPFIAPYNAMLIFMQKPGSKYVATAKVWKERFGRVPKPEARPLIIMKLFGPVSFVFEISDTEGKDVPEEILNPFKASGSLQGKIFFNLREGLTKEAIEYHEQNYGTQKAGHIQRIQRLDRPKKMFLGKNQKGTPIYLISNFAIVVNENLDELEKAATIFHELGYYFCGHLPMPNNIKHIRPRCGLSSSVEEFEAETVCWLLCKRLGIKNPSEDYLSGYLENNEEIPEGISYDAILKSCGKIEQMLNGKYTTPKELFCK
ncbi:MAG: hypothetical protein IJT73_01210 [Selenomonadaceae bacterium]|nr:hypothetical protein [Selenomonadaceae bacterium]